jgi:quinol-cytochrome oxidoreductase complex cytochrome b subunit
MKRHLIRALLFSIAVNLLYYLVVPIISGMYLTYTYVPEITNAYTEVKYLQQEVAFGIIVRNTALSVTLTFAAGIALYALLAWIIAWAKRRLFSRLA